MTLNKSIARVYILLRGKIGPIFTSEAKCLNNDKILHVTSSSEDINPSQDIALFQYLLKKSEKTYVFWCFQGDIERDQ